MLSTNQQKTATAERNERVHKAVLGTSTFQSVALGCWKEGGGRGEWGRPEEKACCAPISHRSRFPVPDRDLQSPYIKITVYRSNGSKGGFQRHELMLMYPAQGENQQSLGNKLPFGQMPHIYSPLLWSSVPGLPRQFTVCSNSASPKVKVGS